MTDLAPPPVSSPAPAQNRQSNAPHLFNQDPALTEYICHWARRVGCLYVETPKAACTTIKRVLQAAEHGPDHHAASAEDVHDRTTSPLLSPGQDPDGFDHALLDPDYFRFAFVRNPYARVLSCWLDKMVTNAFERSRLAPMLGLPPDAPPDLVTFLQAVARQDVADRDPHWATQTHLLNPQAIRYAFIGRFEVFRTDFSRICDHLGIGTYAGDLPDTWHATGAGAKVHAHIGQAEAKLIRQIYEADFRNFGYGWGLHVI